MLINDLYRERGISCDTYIPIDQYGSYSGDKLIVPDNACHTYFGPGDARKFMPSEDMDLRYVGFHLHGELRTFGKYVRITRDRRIGCRDVPTRDFMRRLGYDAYFSGCVSMTLPKRPDGDYRLVYVIDDDAKKGLPFCDPADLRVLTSLCLPDGEPWSLSEERARNRINLLRDTAKLVFTSRLHVYLPCVAMGIPVVFTRPIIPRTSLVEIFTPATVDYIKPLVMANIRNVLFDEGDPVSDKLDEIAVIAERPFDK